MSVLTLKINGKDYQVACGAGEEEHLLMLAEEVGERVGSLVFNTKANMGEGLALVMTALTMADELFENKKEIEKLSAELQRLYARLDTQSAAVEENRLAEMETAMATTLDEIASRIEKIADQIEVR